jgi:hypothetical protein
MIVDILPERMCCMVFHMWKMNNLLKANFLFYQIIKLADTGLKPYLLSEIPTAGKR